MALEAFDVSFSVNAVFEDIVESRMTDGAVISGVGSTSMWIMTVEAGKTFVGTGFQFIDLLVVANQTESYQRFAIKTATLVAFFAHFS